MATSRITDYRTVFLSDNPTMKFRFKKKDAQFVVPLTGRAGWISFWYPDAAPHVVERPCKVDGANGTLIYLAQGDEFPTVGDVLFQATVRIVDVDNGVDRAAFEYSTAIARWRVIPKP